MTRTNKRYGWVPDIPDHRDLLYSAPVAALRALPPKVDLRPNCPHIYNQEQLGSCTANAIAAALEFNQMKQQMSDRFTPSRLFIYYNERVMEGTVNEDSGAMIRDGIKSVGKEGACPEEPTQQHPGPDGIWPYNPDYEFRFRDKPPTECYKVAANHQAVLYYRLVRNLNQMKGCLASGYPFVFGFSVYESFESQDVANTGIASMPSPNEQLLGGHAVLAVGYDDSQRRFIVRNSWDKTWGMEGYFTMPYAYLLDENLADDFWTIRRVENEP
ncbi:MAG: C1 family peptidase [Oscillatoriophycideae cyanobacterium NC_groundwater_1537_Pr4_S-0.65um_50_18]|jgi:C1A family cysteine protease|nr:C1 family peptidase [Oscillatoriophycideae cyanobacterium NC_groundwater_1537_Pr4_S-0.65um_50_18]